MLLRFRAANFASLRDEQELSLIALDEHPDLATGKVPRADEKTLPVAGIFGPNASGKSNMIKAIAFAQGTPACPGTHRNPSSPKRNRRCRDCRCVGRHEEWTGIDVVQTNDWCLLVGKNDDLRGRLLRSHNHRRGRRVLVER